MSARPSNAVQRRVLSVGPPVHRKAGCQSLWSNQSNLETHTHGEGTDEESASPSVAHDPVFGSDRLDRLTTRTTLTDGARS